MVDAKYYDGGTGNAVSPGRSYDVSLDGRFLMLKDATPAGEVPPPPQIVVVQNWLEELKRFVPVKR